MKNSELTLRMRASYSNSFFSLLSPERVSNSDLIEGCGNVSDKDSQGEPSLGGMSESSG